MDPRDPRVDTLAPLFEGAPRFLARLVRGGPFEDADALFEAARRVAHDMPEEEQIELIDAHPRLGAPPGTMSAMSYVEQGYHLDPATDATATGGSGSGTDAPAAPAPVDVAAELARLNDAYETRFGFRYCVFVAGRPREALLPGMTEALDADREQELHRALDAVVDIARDRYGTRTGGSTAPGGSIASSATTGTTSLGWPVEAADATKGAP